MRVSTTLPAQVSAHFCPSAGSTTSARSGAPRPRSWPAVGQGRFGRRLVYDRSWCWCPLGRGRKRAETSGGGRSGLKPREEGGAGVGGKREGAGAVRRPGGSTR